MLTRLTALRAERAARLSRDQSRRRPGDHGARAARACARSPRAGSCAGSCGARRSARCRSSFGYALPFAFGLPPLQGFEYSALLLGLIPLAFASAIVRYRLMDVEVIIKRALVYAAALAAIAAIYGVLLWTAGALFLRDAEQRNPVIALLATLVVVLLSRPVKNAIQAGLDRVYYRDRYDYRRALVGFARDLNSDLDLQRLSERLVTRVMETLLVDRMALMLAPASQDEAGGLRRPSRTPASPTRRRRCSRGVRGGDAAASPGTRWRSTTTCRCAASTRARSSSGARPGSTTSCRASRRKGTIAVDGARAARPSDASR